MIGICTQPDDGMASVDPRDSSHALTVREGERRSEGDNLNALDQRRLMLEQRGSADEEPVQPRPQAVFAVVIRGYGEPEGLFHVAVMCRASPGAKAVYDGPIFGPGALDIARLAAGALADTYRLPVVEDYGAST